MRGRILLGCVGFVIACALACPVQRLSAQSAGASRHEAGIAISRAGGSKPAVSAQPSVAAEESLSLEIKLGDREFSGDKALVPEDVFEVVFTNASARPLEIWNPDEEIGWRQLSFELIDLRSKRKYVVRRVPFPHSQRQTAAALRQSDEGVERVTITSHRDYRYSILLSDCQASDHDWTGLPTAELRRRFSLAARFTSPDVPPKKASHVWTGVVQSPSVDVRIANWQPHPPVYYLKQKFPARALSLFKAEPFWISKRDEIRQTPLHIAAARGYVDVVRWLLDHGADVNATAYDSNLPPLHLAGNPEVVRLILRKKPNLSTLDSATGQTVLQKAAERWTKAATDDERRTWRTVVQMYLDAGAEMDLFTAIDLDDRARVKVLLAKSPRFANAFRQESPLRRAASLGRLEICRYLIEQHHVDVNDLERGHGFPILKEAVAFPEVVRLLIENGADLQKRISWRGGRRPAGIWVVGDEGTALHYAAQDGVSATIQLLLDHGVDPFATAEDPDENQKREQTALDVAAVFGRADKAAAIVHHPRFRNADRTLRQRVLNRCLVSERWDGGPVPHVDRPKLLEMLIESGADPNTTANGITPLQRSAAAMSPEDDIRNAGIKKETQVLLRHGARLDLFSAVALADEPAIARLLKQDPSCANARGPGGVPALHLAVELDEERVVKALLNAGADVDILNRSENRTNNMPLHVAAFWGRTSIARTLIEHGANVNAQSTDDQWTPLHAAVSSGHVEIARLLLEHGAKTDARDDEGHTPLEVGSAEQSLSAFKALFRKYDKHAGP